MLIDRATGDCARCNDDDGKGMELIKQVLVLILPLALRTSRQQ